MAERAHYYGTGRRKTSVARVFLRAGEGHITVNRRPFDEYFPRESLRLLVAQPLELTGTAAQFDVKVNVAGGGLSGQAGAVRHGIARALLEFRERGAREVEERLVVALERVGRERLEGVLQRLLRFEDELDLFLALQALFLEPRLELARALFQLRALLHRLQQLAAELLRIPFQLRRLHAHAIGVVARRIEDAPPQPLLLPLPPLGNTHRTLVREVNNVNLRLDVPFGKSVLTGGVRSGVWRMEAKRQT